MKDLLAAFAATTLSIILTFGTTGVINHDRTAETMNAHLPIARQIDSLLHAKQKTTLLWPFVQF